MTEENNLKGKEEPDIEKGKYEKWERNIGSSGPSMAITIPSDLKHKMGLKKKEEVWIVHPKGEDYFMVGYEEAFKPDLKITDPKTGEKVPIETLRTSFSEEEIKEILREIEENGK